MKHSLCVIALLAGGAAAQTAAPADAPPGPVLAPHHGDVLFQHFRQRWYAALGSLMVSQHFDRLAPHEAEAELLRGGLLLDWGQADEAAEVFARLAEQHPSHRDRAWTMLARARWQRGRIDEAEAALARVQAPLKGERDDERVLLQAQVHLARGRATEAATVLQALSAQPRRSASSLALHNRAVALLQAGDEAGARAALDAIGRAPAASEEQRTLRDRANLTLGLQALNEAADPTLARSALQRVRLHGRASAKALLADGWAALSQGRGSEALVSWLELAGRPATEAAVFEARLAVPQAYADLGARGEALRRADSLVAGFDTDAAALDRARVALQDGSALAPLLARMDGIEPGQEPELDLPPGDHAVALAPLWADHSFQQSLNRWADLQWVAGDLQRWTQALPAFDDMLQLRRSAFESRLPATLKMAHDETQGLAAQQRVQTELMQQLDQAAQQDDGLALATAAEQAQRQRLQRLRQDLATLEPGDEQATLADRVRRVEGLLTWQLARERPERLRAAQLSLRDLDRSLSDAAQRLQALQQAQTEEPQRLAALAARTQALAQQLAAVQPRVLALADEQRLALQSLAVAVLDQQRQQLDGYRVQARLLQAQLQDGSLAAMAPSGGRDAQP